MARIKTNHCSRYVTDLTSTLSLIWFSIKNLPFPNSLLVPLMGFSYLRDSDVLKESYPSENSSSEGDEWFKETLRKERNKTILHSSFHYCHSSVICFQEFVRKFNKSDYRKFILVENRPLSSLQECIQFSSKVILHDLKPERIMKLLFFVSEYVHLSPYRGSEFR